MLGYMMILKLFKTLSLELKKNLPICDYLVLLSRSLDNYFSFRAVSNYPRQEPPV